VTEKQKIPWIRVSVEAAAIVASILLAFAIDAWWEERLDRSDELQDLERLQFEFDSNISGINQMSVIYRVRETGIEILDQIADAQGRGANSIEVSVLKVYFLSTAPTFEANDAVLNGLVQSGRLEIVRDSRVIVALASWERSLRNYLEVAHRARRNSDTLLVPALAKRGDIASALIGRDTFLANESRNEPIPTATIAIDDEIKGLIAQKVENMDRAIRLLNRAQEAAEQALVALKAAQSN